MSKPIIKMPIGMVDQPFYVNESLIFHVLPSDSMTEFLEDDNDWINIIVLGYNQDGELIARYDFFDDEDVFRPIFFRVPKERFSDLEPVYNYDDDEEEDENE